MSHSYGLTKENKGAVDSALDFPRLSLKKGEKARLAIFTIKKGDDGKQSIGLPEPEGGYYFDLRIPGAEREYVGSFECLADEATKGENGFDPDACPHCAAVLAGNISEEVMRARKRKFVMPVVRYKTQTGSSELVVPHSVEVIAWRFTDRYFNVIVDEQERWAASNGLLGHDLTLTCTAANYQNFDIGVEPDAAYAKDRELGELVIKTFLSQTGQLPNGLRRVLGNTLTAIDLEKKIADTVESAAQLGIGGPTASVIPTVDAATVEGLAADLLGTASNAETVTAAPVQTEIEVTAASEVPDVQATDEVASSDEVDFDEFFSS